MSTEPKRNRDARAAQGGACNPRALIAALARGVEEIVAEQGDNMGHKKITSDPAMRLITMQLAFLMGQWEIDNESHVYGELMSQVEEAA